MPQKKSKAEHVQWEFERFKELCPDLPSGNIEIWEDSGNDPPDVCIGNGKLGIEFTDFYHGNEIDWAGGGSILQATEDQLRKLVNKAKEQFNTTNSSPLSVLIVWHKHISLYSLPKTGIDQALVTIVRGSIPQFENDHLVIKRDALSAGNLESYIESIWIARMSEDAKSTWRSMGRGRIDVGAESLKSFVRDKEQDLERIRKKCDEAWLVIVGSGESVSSSISPKHDVKPGCITSKFDRVYLLDAAHRQVICLTADKNEQGGHPS